MKRTAVAFGAWFCVIGAAAAGLEACTVQNGFVRFSDEFLKAATEGMPPVDGYSRIVPLHDLKGMRIGYLYIDPNGSSVLYDTRFNRIGNVVPGERPCPKQNFCGRTRSWSGC